MLDLVLLVSDLLMRIAGPTPLRPAALIRGPLVQRHYLAIRPPPVRHRLLRQVD